MQSFMLNLVMVPETKWYYLTLRSIT